MYSFILSAVRNGGNPDTASLKAAIIQDVLRTLRQELPEDINMEAVVSAVTQAIENTLPVVAYGGILKTPKIKVDRALTGISLQVRFTPKSVSGASDMAGVVRFGSVGVCKTPY